MVIIVKTHSLNHFEVYNTILLTVVTALDIRSPELTHLTTGSITFDQYLPISLSFSPWQPSSSLFEFRFSGFHVWWTQTLVFVWHFTQHDALRLHLCCPEWQDFLYLWLNNILLCVCITSSLPVHPSMGARLASTSWLFWVILRSVTMGKSDCISFECISSCFKDSVPTRVPESGFSVVILTVCL